jgi:uncharacterized delta-60 repeat protein
MHGGMHMNIATRSLSILVLTALLNACGGSSGPPTTTSSCAPADIPGEPDVLGQPTINASKASPGDTVDVSIPIDADTGYVIVQLYSGTISSTTRVSDVHLTIANPQTQTISMKLPVNATTADNYHVGIGVCSDAATCDGSGTGTGTAVYYGIETNADTVLSRALLMRNGAVVNSSSATCMNDLTVDVAPGNTPALTGVLDSGFNVNGIVNVDLGGEEYADSAVMQPDGKLLVLGESDPNILLLRLNSDGTRDSSFGNNGLLTLHVGATIDHANDLVFDNQGRIVITGLALINGAQRIFVMRLNADGSKDTSFGADGVAALDTSSFGSMSWVNTIAIDHMQRIVVAGSTSQPGTLTADRNLLFARLTPDGVLDTGFNGTGYYTRDINTGYPTLTDSYEEVYDIKIDDNDGILFAGAANITTSSSSVSTADSIMGRINPDGTPDLTFGTGSTTPPLCSVGAPCGIVFVSSSYVDATFRMVVAGASIYSTGTKCGLSFLDRHEINGVDQPFTGGTTLYCAGSTSYNGDDILALPDGKLLVGGSSGSQWIGTWQTVGVPYSGQSFLTQYNTDGTLDTSFGTSMGTVLNPLGGLSNRLIRLARRSGDGHVYAVGNSYNGTDNDIYIARYQ